jgi:hypothetical protein
MKITLESQAGRYLVLSTNHSIVHIETMSSSWPSGYFRVVEAFPSYVSLGSTG